MQYVEHKTGNKLIREALLSSSGISYTPSKPSIPLKPLTRMHQLWNEQEFNKINLPLAITHISAEDQKFFSNKEDIRVLDMPIKFPNTNYRIPNELKDFVPIIKMVSEHEHAINPHIHEYYCYITVDRRLVKQGDSTRKGGIHVDGFQGSRLEKRLPIDHSYIVQDSIPTIFYNQTFKVEPTWDKTCHNYFEGFAAQIQNGTQVRYEPFTLLLIDAYCLHEADIAKEDTYRTFCRLSYTVREFDRLGNAHNPMFDYQWKMHPRNTQDYLVCPV